MARPSPNPSSAVLAITRPLPAPRSLTGELVARRAEGLVITRQGVGAFVPENARRPLRIDFDQLSPLRAVLDVMELRTGIEIEAAGLAAARASTPQIRKI